MTPALPRLRHGEDWRAIVSLNAYRSLIGFGLVTLLLFGTADELFDLALPDVFRVACLVYLVQCALALFAALSRHPALQLQVLFACAADIALCTTLTFASTGVSSGLGMLLIAPIAAAGMLLPGRLSGLMAACAAIAIIGQEASRAIRFVDTPGEFVQAGILGASFFMIAGAAHWLAQRVAASEALAAERASKARDLATLNRFIIQRMEIGAVVVDGAHRIELINDAAVRLLDAERPAPLDEPLAHLSPALDRALVHWSDFNPAATEVIRAGSHSLLPMFSRLGNEPHAPILIFLEDAMRQSEQAQQLKLVSIGRLSASIAHEIRNPLGAISHAGQLLSESTTIDDADRRLLDIVHRHTRRIDNIIDSVMGLSRRSRSSRQMLLLSQWLYDAVDDYCNSNDDAPDFQIEAFDGELQVEFDPDHLRQVLFNLWDNTRRYARVDGTELVIRLAGRLNRSERFCLDVTDNGPGIASDILDQIMEPFFTTTREGTGLGLHIAGELCEANGAQLLPVAHSRGACFRIVFAHVWPVDAAATGLPHLKSMQ